MLTDKMKKELVEATAQSPIMFEVLRYFKGRKRSRENIKVGVARRQLKQAGVSLPSFKIREAFLTLNSLGIGQTFNKGSSINLFYPMQEIGSVLDIVGDTKALSKIVSKPAPVERKFVHTIEVNNGRLIIKGSNVNADLPLDIDDRSFDRAVMAMTKLAG